MKSRRSAVAVEYHTAYPVRDNKRGRVVFQSPLFKTEERGAEARAFNQALDMAEAKGFTPKEFKRAKTIHMPPFE